MLQYKSSSPAWVCCFVPHQEQNSKSTFKTTLPARMKRLLLHHERGKKKNPVASATHLAADADETALWYVCLYIGKTSFEDQCHPHRALRLELLRQPLQLTLGSHTGLLKLPFNYCGSLLTFHSSFPTGADSLGVFGLVRSYFGKDLFEKWQIKRS